MPQPRPMKESTKLARKENCTVVEHDYRQEQIAGRAKALRCKPFLGGCSLQFAQAASKKRNNGGS